MIMKTKQLERWYPAGERKDQPSQRLAGKMPAFRVFFAICLLSTPFFGQTPVVINDPTVEPVKTELSAAEQSLMDKGILPKVREKLKSDICEETIEISGRA